MEERPAPLALKIVAFIMFLFLLAPVVLVVPISFSADSYMTFPPSGWSLRWYVDLMHNSKMIGAPAPARSLRSSLPFCPC